MLRLRAAIRRPAPYLVIPVLLTSFVVTPAWAQPAAPATPPAAAATAPTAPPDPVVAKVNDQPIYLSDLQAAAQGLPDNLRGLPPQMLFPMLLDQLIDGRALVLEAKKTALDKDPLVAHEIAAAEDRALQSAMLSKEVGPSVTDEAVKARFDKEAAGKPPEEEVHASHILVANEADAKKIIAELNAGADFATLAKQNSTDPGGKTGGDLGFFKKDDMVPEFAEAAFALKPGQITQTPVHTQFGWHVIKLDERRSAPPATFEQSRDALRQKMIQEGVQQAVAQARTGITVQKFNMDGTPLKATDTAVPPPAAKP
jgi:peptidyl-prolyl cis-trans isomerase C